MDKKSFVVYFGAAGSGVAYCQHTSSRPDFFVDNDPKKVGSTVNGVEIKNPDSIREVDIEKVVITSGYMKDIYRQLLTLGVPEKRIEVPPKSLIGFHCFSDQNLRISAARSLSAYMANFDLVAVGGTALGFVRDRDFIHWDNDIDLFGPFQKKQQIIDFLESNAIDFFIEESSLTKSIKSSFRFEGQTEIPLSIDFFDRSASSFLDVFEDYSWEWPTNMFTDFKILEIHGFKINVPNPPEEYLRGVYGNDWSKPKPDFGYAEYAGFTENTPSSS